MKLVEIKLVPRQNVEKVHVLAHKARIDSHYPVQFNIAANQKKIQYLDTDTSVLRQAEQPRVCI